MFYYKIAFSGRNLAPLTYRSPIKFQKFTAVSVPLNNKPTQGYIVQECDEPEFKTLEILAAPPYRLTPIQASMAEFIARYYTCEIGVSLGLFEPLASESRAKNLDVEPNLNANKNHAKALSDTPNLDTDDSQTKILNDTQNLDGKNPQNIKFKEPILNEKQTQALNFALANKTSLIFGDTGSGKSEIYISAIAQALNQGEQALFLMPEISLTPQMQRRLEGFFGDSVAVWHSKIAPKKKEQILKELQSGKVRLIAGARSALFLPLPKLKLIIVDEEHDDSYKNTGSRPHYNARDLALFLASKFDLRVIMGSASPSLTTYHKQPTFRLKGTFYAGEKHYIFDESEAGLSEILKEEIAHCLGEKKQAIICLPTRANFKYLECTSCNETIKCPFCSVGMSFYKRQNMLKCQYCDFRMAASTPCPKCGSQMIQARKIGTSELLEQLENAFANARIAKFDRDEITTQNKLVRALKSFNDGEIDILVGTQMLSKGHDYHSVGLAVIMGIDELLNFPDFRARERTLSLAMQVAGRTGRNGIGRVVVQSKQREFFESYIADYERFLTDELSFREELYPPFTRLLRVVVSHKKEDAARDITQELVERVESLRAKFELEIVGHGKCGVEMIGAKYRYEILVRSRSHLALLAAAKACDIQNADVDIDPVNFA